MQHENIYNREKKKKKDKTAWNWAQSSKIALTPLQKKFLFSGQYSYITETFSVGLTIIRFRLDNLYAVDESS